ncbi:MAG: P-loop NTPase [Bdellovibrionales bacterium]
MARANAFKAMDQFSVMFSGVSWITSLLTYPLGLATFHSRWHKGAVSGAITVTTPQNLSLVDAKKGIRYVGQNQCANIGVVENMSSFQPPGGGEPISLFPKGDLDGYLDSPGTNKTGRNSFSSQHCHGK